MACDVGDAEQHLFLMEACTTKAHRSFLLVCPHCLAACQGKYGHHNPDATHHAARLAPAKSLLNQNVLVEGRNEPCSPNRQFGSSLSLPPRLAFPLGVDGRSAIAYLGPGLESSLALPKSLPPPIS